MTPVRSSRKYLPRSEDEMKRIEEIVKKAMGYLTERQDQAEVVNVHSVSGLKNGRRGGGSGGGLDERGCRIFRYAVGGCCSS